jgi:hypothetical protein
MTTASDLADTRPSPTGEVAVTVKEYVVRRVRPSIEHVVALVVQLSPPGEATDVYDVMANPPSLEGAVQLTAADPLPVTAVTPVGAPGTVAGIATFEIPGVADEPRLLLATTLKVYEVPLVRPVTVHSNALSVVHICPPGEAVTV